ncbi:MAG: DUF2480 family protein [Putridiphycobacter sp.]|nr:DUF2480 family protein [Putridiphycobacter sp.]
MEMPFENKVEKANIQQIDLKDYVEKEIIMSFDLKGGLWQEMVVKEKVFRAFVKSTNWIDYKDAIVSLHCSIDAIIPAWAYMLVTSELNAVGATVYYGDLKTVEETRFFENLNKIDLAPLTNQRVMVKGCSSIPNPTRAYVELTNILVPVVKSLMFGEPCSAVPVYKKR